MSNKENTLLETQKTRAMAIRLPASLFKHKKSKIVADARLKKPQLKHDTDLGETCQKSQHSQPSLKTPGGNTYIFKK